MIVVIVGMHRSGTSALSGLLHQNGVSMGEAQNFSPAPSKENPKGFFENYQFRIVNDRILHNYGYSVKTFNPDVPVCTETTDKIKATIKTMITSYHKRYFHWGFKDPRTCLTLNVWKKIFENLKLNPKYILIKRDVQEIARSMAARGNEGTHQQFVDLANAYYQMANINNFYDFEINFRTLINDTDNECKRISEYLQIPIINNGFI